MRIQSFRTDTNLSSTCRNMSKYIKIFVQIKKLVTDADSIMPPSVGINTTSMMSLETNQLVETRQCSKIISGNTIYISAQLFKSFAMMPTEIGKHKIKLSIFRSWPKIPAYNHKHYLGLL